MNWIYTDHIKKQMIERKISRSSVELTLNEPDEIIQEREGRRVYQRAVDNLLFRVVTENDKLITVYFTSKIDKYRKGNI